MSVRENSFNVQCLGPGSHTLGVTDCGGWGPSPPSKDHTLRLSPISNTKIFRFFSVTLGFLPFHQDHSFES